MTSPLGKLGRQLGSLGDRLTSRSASLRRGGRDSEAEATGGSGGKNSAGRALGKYGVLPAGPSATSEEEEGEAALHDLAPGYFDPPEQFDALEHELRQLPVAFEAAHLEAVADERTGVLEVGGCWACRAGTLENWREQRCMRPLLQACVYACSRWCLLPFQQLNWHAASPPAVACRSTQRHLPGAGSACRGPAGTASCLLDPPKAPTCTPSSPDPQVVSEKLSQHVLANYSKFVEGVEEVVCVERDLQAAHTTTKLARERLALALREVSAADVPTCLHACAAGTYVPGRLVLQALASEGWGPKSWVPYL